MGKLVEFRIKKKLKGKQKEPPPSEEHKDLNVEEFRDLCFVLTREALKHKNKEAIAANIISWLISNIDRTVMEGYVNWLFDEE